MKTSRFRLLPGRNPETGACIGLLLAVSSCMPAHPPEASTPRALEPVPIERVISRAKAESWFVRIETTTSTLEGRVLDWGTVDFAMADTTLLFADVSSVQRRSNQGSGTVAGGVLGALSLGLFGFALTGLCDNTSCGGKDYLALIGGGVVAGGMFGMITGELLKPGEDVWVPVWQRSN